MNCKEVKENIDIYNAQEMQRLGIYDEIKMHIEKCEECKIYLDNLKRTKLAVENLKKSQLNQYQLVKKENREFNNELWLKVRKAQNKPKSLLLIWGEIAVVIVLIVISIWNSQILSKEFITIVGIIFMAIGMVYTNHKEVEYDE